MSDITGTHVLLKDKNGNYLFPETIKTNVIAVDNLYVPTSDAVSKAISAALSNTPTVNVKRRYPDIATANPLNANSTAITIDDSCDINVLKKGNELSYAFNINGEPLNLTDYWASEATEPSTAIISIGNFVIVTGIVPAFDFEAINSLVRIYIPEIRNMVGVNLTLINPGIRSTGVDNKIAEFAGFIDNWLYVFLDGSGSGAKAGVAYTVFGTK